MVFINVTSLLCIYSNAHITMDTNRFNYYVTQHGYLTLSLIAQHHMIPHDVGMPW